MYICNLNDRKHLIKMINKSGTMWFVFIALTILLGSTGSPKSYAQESRGIIEQLQQYHPDMGKITVSQDARITQLLNAYYIQNASRPGMQGFRIRLFFDLGQQSRKNSEDVMNEFLENYPGIAVYRTFDSPYYKVSVGDYRTRDEAIKDLKKFERKYMKAFVVPEWINFPRIQ
jgi:hypothetical protein